MLFFRIHRYRLFAFDIDGTIAESKMPLDDTMGNLLLGLLAGHHVALVSGASYSQMLLQIVERLPGEAKEHFGRLWLVPVSGSLLYGYRDGVWVCLDSHVFTDEEKVTVRSALADTLRDIRYDEPAHIYGDVFEDREGQMTFSAVGQEAPLSEKKKWRETSDIRPVLLPMLQEKLPFCEVRSGGMTSIDITKKGIDKAFAMENLSRFSGVGIKEMIYVGDALYPGGNDEAVKKSHVHTISVKDVADTSMLIRKIVSRTADKTSV